MIEYYEKIKSFRKTAFKFNVNVKTIIKWVKRYKLYGLSGLLDIKRAPKRIHNKLSENIEKNIIFLRKQSGFGARRLKYEFELNVSVGAIYRILKQNNLIKKIKRKYQKKQDLRLIKQKLKPLQFLQMDIKYLDDIPDFFPFYLKYKLPKYQITVRDVKSGTLFFFFTYEKCVASTVMALKIVLNHLKSHGISLNNVTIQVDNGAEFSGIKIHNDRGFKKEIEALGPSVKYIPPHYPNANADVESSHRLIEDEFYSRESFYSKQDFLDKAKTYQLLFNFSRKNSYKNNKSPVDILKENNFDERIAFIQPIIVDELFKIYRQNFSYKYNYLYHHVPDLPVLIWDTVKNSVDFLRDIKGFLLG